MRKLEGEADLAPVIWTYSRLAGRTGAKVFLALLLPSVGAVAWYASGSVALGLVAVACVACTLAPAVSPTSYTLNAEGIAVRHLWRRSVQPWSAFKRLAVDGDLLVLSPFERPSYRDAFRGQYLRLGGTGAQVREAALRFALSRLSARGQAAEQRVR